MDTKVFPRVPWLLEPYAVLLHTSADDLLQVEVKDDDYPPPLYISRNGYDQTGLQAKLACAYNAGNPSREELLHFTKAQLTPLIGGEIYLDIPDRRELGRIILYVDDDFRIPGSSYGAWATISFLQEMLSPDTVLGGDPDAVLGLFETFASRSKGIDLLLCDHNLNWGGNESHPPFPSGCELVQELRSRGYLIPPIILHSDVATIPSGWENVAEYKRFAPKYNHQDPNGDNSCRDYLLNSIIHVLSK